MSDRVRIGGHRYSWCDPNPDFLNIVILPKPVFETDIEIIRQQAAAMVNKTPMPKNLAKPHRIIAKLLEGDEAKLQRSLSAGYVSYFDKLIFDSRFEQRRLKILNGLFPCLSYCGMKPSIRGDAARDLSGTVGDETLSFTLDSGTVQK